MKQGTFPKRCFVASLSSVLCSSLTPSCHEYDFVLTYSHHLYPMVTGRVSPVPDHTFHTYRFPYAGELTMVLFQSLPIFLDFRHNRHGSTSPSLLLFWSSFIYDTAEFTLCYGLHDCHIKKKRYVIHPLCTLHYCNAPNLATRLTGNYRDRTCTGWYGPSSLDTPYYKKAPLTTNLFLVRGTTKNSFTFPSFF